MENLFYEKSLAMRSGFIAIIRNAKDRMGLERCHLNEIYTRRTRVFDLDLKSVIRTNSNEMVTAVRYYRRVLYSSEELERKRFFAGEGRLSSSQIAVRDNADASEIDQAHYGNLGCLYPTRRIHRIILYNAFGLSLVLVDVAARFVRHTI